MASWDTLIVVNVGLPYVLLSPDISPFLLKNFHLGRVFEFVEMSGFLTICYFIQILHILMVLEM